MGRVERLFKMYVWVVKQHILTARVGAYRPIFRPVKHIIDSLNVDYSNFRSASSRRISGG